MIKTQFGAITRLTHGAAEVKVTAECRPDGAEDVKKIISASATAYLVSKDANGDETTARAKVVFTLVYLAEGGYKKVEASTETSAVLPFGECEVTVSASDARTSYQDGKITARATVCFRAERTGGDSLNVLVGGDDLAVKRGEIKTDVPCGTSRGEFRVEDEFELGYAVSEVLGHTENAVVEEVVSGISSIIVSGNVNICLALLPFSENSDILKERRKIPFRFEIENTGALPDMRAYGNASVKKVAVVVNADEGAAKSTVSVDLTLYANGEAVSEEVAEFAEDAYSNACEVSLNRENQLIGQFVGQFCHVENVSGAADGEVPEGGRLIAAIGESLTVLSTAASEGKLTVNAILKADAVFRNADNGTAVTRAEMPVSFDVEATGMPEFIGAELIDFAARVTGGEIRFDAVIAVVYRAYIERGANFVIGLEEGAAKPVNECAVSVCIPAAGDGLWEISKRLGVTGEQIMKFNPGLTFPLSGEERIVVYRRKT